MELWNNEYPVYLNYKSISDFELYLNDINIITHILIDDLDNNQIVGWLFIFERDNENWFGIIIDSKMHNKGLGTKLLNIAKNKSSELNGWVIEHNEDVKSNGEKYKSPVNFYIKNDFEVLPDIRLNLEFFKVVKINWKK